jgi:hypothetical protein
MHNFVAERFNKPTWCDYCGDLIMGVVGKQGERGRRLFLTTPGLQCHNAQCEFAVHRKCMQDALNISCGKTESRQEPPSPPFESNEVVLNALGSLYF